MTEPVTVDTCARLACDAASAWQKVCFYEHVVLRPPMWLRLVLPAPAGVTGTCDRVGGLSSCRYDDGGQLTKRIVALEPGRRIDFDVIQQTLRWRSVVRLRRGAIAVEPHPEGGCVVRMRTHYEFRRRAFVLLRPFVALAVRGVHRAVLADMSAALAHDVARQSHALARRPS